MRALRILQVNSRYREYGGEERVVENDAESLRAAGHEVRLFETTNQGSKAATVGSLAASSWNLRQAARIRRVVREWRPDVAHVHNTWFSLSPSVFRALEDEGVPVVATIHNYRVACVSADLWRDGRVCHDCLGRDFPAPGVRHGCYRGSRTLSAAVATSSKVQAHLLARLPTGRVVVSSEFLKGVLVRAGLREDLFTVIPWTTPDPGPRPSRPSESKEVYFVGRLEPGTKGIERLIERWSRARAEGSLGDLRLNLIGTGPLAGSASIEAEGVRQLGFMERDELDRHLLSGRALVVPSMVEETFGLVPIEGFAAGLPVLATDRGALSETIGLLGRECLLPADSDRAWVEGLARLSDDGWVDRTGERARQLFETKFAEPGDAGGIGQLLPAVALGARSDSQPAKEVSP
jgi:glycosyltransferase involved in cell wall biosynthesis